MHLDDTKNDTMKIGFILFHTCPPCDMYSYLGRHTHIPVHSKYMMGNVHYKENNVLIVMVCTVT